MTGYSSGSAGPVMVIGCGAMGQAMAERLYAADVRVFAYDTDATRLEGLSAGIECLNDLTLVPADIRRFILSLPSSASVSQVLNANDGVPPRCAPNSLFVDTSTSDPHLTRELGASLSQMGHRLLDAPVSGGRAGAQTGTLTFYIGGLEADMEAGAELFSILGKSRIHVGPIGAGHVAKLANNLLCAGNLWLIREAAGIAQKEGLNLARLVTALNGGSGRSAVSEINLPRWVLSENYDSGFTTGLMCKDLQLTAELAHVDHVSFALGEHLFTLWQGVTEQEGEERDFNEVVIPYKQSDQTDG